MQYQKYNREALIKRLRDNYVENEILIVEIWSLQDFEILEEDGHDFTDLSKEDRERILVMFQNLYGDDSGMTTSDLLSTIQAFREGRKNNALPNL
jgi:hypothetical protein